MTMQLDNDFRAIEGLVCLAKALFSNLALLRAFETTRQDRPARSSRLSFPRYDSVAREAVSRAHREGLFLQMRRQMPHLTDEALENRLILINAQFRSSLRLMRAGHAHRSRARSDECDTPDSVLDGLLSNPLDVLEVLADTFLREAPDGSLRVHSRLIAHWQDLILVVPPLLVSSAWIHRRAWSQIGAQDGHSARLELFEQMTRWLADSTLPVDDDPALDYICRQHGLDETHMHLMGATEAEKVWCDAIRRPKAAVSALAAGRQKARETGLRMSIGSGVDRLLRQEDSQLTANLLLRRLNDAAMLKGLLLLCGRGGSAEDLSDVVSPSNFYALELRRDLRNLPPHLPLVVEEAWHLCSILASFDLPQARQATGQMFWHYMLLRAQFCRLLVQQAGQIGFDQFQYITLNELRETTETEFAERFRQIERGQQRYIAFLEGRFAPKADKKKLVDLLGAILRGYLRFLDEDEHSRSHPRATDMRYGSLAELVTLVRHRETEGRASRDGVEDPRQNRMTRAEGNPSTISKRRLRLGLVMHFIKRHNRSEYSALLSAVSPRPRCRHAQMRGEMEAQSRALVKLLSDTPQLRHFIRGADAAGNERHAGPEVFAPAFRILRRAGMQRFTFHAGEDFAHMASGLRTMFEALLFLNLDAGCRLGHGTASGLSPEAWWRAIGNTAVMPTEDRLDDLVFARHLLLSNALLPERLALIDAEIGRLTMQIWDDPHLTPDLLAEAWKLRHLDPRARRFSGNDVDPHRRAEAFLHMEAECRNRAAHRHFLRRHGDHSADPAFTPRQMRDEIARGATQMAVTRESDILNVETLQTLQGCVLKVLNQRRMAIETLPSSNLRISIHQRYEDHHSLNWLGLGSGSLGMPVDVVVGSDDPGIFATSLRMEYAQLMRCLRDESRHSGVRFDPLKPIEKICLNAKAFRF